jgi:hypothetical protein
MRPTHRCKAICYTLVASYNSPRENMTSQSEQAAIELRVDGEIYGLFLKPGMQVLELMSSRVSHLPEATGDIRVTGLGMNAEELAQTPRLEARILHDHNVQPGCHSRTAASTSPSAASPSSTSSSRLRYCVNSGACSNPGRPLSSPSPTTGSRPRQLNCGRNCTRSSTWAWYWNISARPAVSLRCTVNHCADCHIRRMTSTPASSHTRTTCSRSGVTLKHEYSKLAQGLQWP